MKRWLIVGAIVVFTLGTAAGALADSLTKQINVQYNNIKLKVNGQIVDSGTSESFIVVDEGRTYVPARYLAEALGAKVSWDGSANTVLVYSPSYVEVRSANDMTSYAAPYYGISLQLPQGGKLNRPVDELFQVESPIGQIDVMRLDNSGAFDVMSYGNQLKTGLSAKGFQMSDPVSLQVPGALAAGQITGTATRNGVVVRIKFRFILGQRDVWVLGATYSDAMNSQYGPAVDKAFDSFTLSGN